MKEAIVFDMYNTLAYYPGRGAKSLYEVLDEIGINSDEDIAEAKSILYTENFSSLGEAIERVRPGAQIDLGQYQKILEEDMASIRLYPEVQGVLGELRGRGYKLGIISNLAFPFKQPILDLGLDKAVDELVLSFEVGCQKPQSQIYQVMVDRLGISAEKILMTGDNYMKDYFYPLMFGMHAVHLDRENVSDAGHRINTLEGIFSFTNSFGKKPTTLVVG